MKTTQNLGFNPRELLWGLILAVAVCFWPPVVQAGTPNYTLGMSNLVEGPAAGTNTVYLSVTPPGSSWSAQTNAPWLHLSAANQGGSNSTNIVFTFDANPGATRTGTITLENQTLTVTQAGIGYNPAGLQQFAYETNAFLEALNDNAFAVDLAGNLYAGSGIYEPPVEIMKWTRSNNVVTSFATSGLTSVVALAVAPSGNVYISDQASPPALREWQAATANLVTLATNVGPTAIAIDASENVYFPNGKTILEWVAASNELVTLLTSNTATPLKSPTGIAVDAYTNIYFIDATTNLKVWNPSTGAYRLVLTFPKGQGLQSVAVDADNNVYYTEIGGKLLEWSPFTGLVQTLADTPNGEDTGLYEAFCTVVDGRGNVGVLDYLSGLNYLASAYVDQNPVFEGNPAGNDALPAVVPSSTAPLFGYAPTTDQFWLTVDGMTNGVVTFSFTSNSGPARVGHVIVLSDPVPILQQAISATGQFGYSNRAEGPAPVTDSVLVSMTPPESAWTVSTDSSWIHLGMTNSYGPTVLPFMLDANAGSTRTGTVTLSGPGVQTTNMTITQAGATYVQVQGATALGGTGAYDSFFGYDGVLNFEPPPTQYPIPLAGMVVDPSGNVYVADAERHTVYEWIPTNNGIVPIVTNLGYPEAVAVDGAGNLYIADYSSNAILQWSASTGMLTNLAFADEPNAVALDRNTNVFFTQWGNSVPIEEWVATNNSVAQVFDFGIADYETEGLAVDSSGNVYLSGGSAANGTATFGLVSNLYTLTGLDYDESVGPLAVDGGGNVEMAALEIVDSSFGGIERWNVLTHQITRSYMQSELEYGILGLTVDGGGNIYFIDSFPIYGLQPGMLAELPYAFVDPTPRVEGAAAGTDALPPVVPATQNLLPPFAPVSDQPWLTITGVNNGIVTFAFSAAASSRVGHILLLNQSIPIIQGGPAFSLAATSFTEGPSAGSDGVLLSVAPAGSAWTASAYASWLHVAAGSQSGDASTNVVFTFDANAGPTRAGTLVIASQTVTVTQAGAAYLPALMVPVAFGAGGFNTEPGNYTVAPTVPLALDGACNLYYTSSSNHLYERNFATGAISNLSAAGANAYLLGDSDSTPANIGGLAVDGSGNVYIAGWTDDLATPIAVWNPATQVSQSLVCWWVFSATGVAVDNGGNVFYADTENQDVAKWYSLNSNVIMAPATFGSPTGVALDALNNLEIADLSANAIYVWSSSSNTVTTLVASNATTPLSGPVGVAADVSGDIYIADTDNVVKKWSVANSTLTTVASAGLSSVGNVALDPLRNLYIVDPHAGVIEELPRAFVDSTPRQETAAAGTDVLTPVLPAAESLAPPLQPASDQPWLTVDAIMAGSVTFSFAENTSGAPRTGHITVLGQPIAITQGVIGTAPLLTNIMILRNATNNAATFQFGFANNPDASFIVLSTTNLTLPLPSWTVVGPVANLGGGQFQFTAPVLTNGLAVYYSVRSP